MNLMISFWKLVNKSCNLIWNDHMCSYKKAVKKAVKKDSKTSALHSCWNWRLLLINSQPPLSQPAFFLFGDDVEIMWKLSDGIRLVTSELAVRSCDCVVVTHTVPQRAISHWSDLALFSWLQHIANQQRRMRRMQDEGVEVGIACDTFHTSNL